MITISHQMLLKTTLPLLNQYFEFFADLGRNKVGPNRDEII